ncbi:hypothetical protein [Limnoraphis robusta]|uniref:Uncharacterized protein n=1 Tax=Limnoraphis robusta CCNP1315 TaxID=3110306 RepID=A0ABU5U6Q8_9CYAN|nr:hypothetical protein [Limnoraphis robusta]MEA5522896.1 hypothetical protein [Limnoraphis robusta CCNP1315]MEA5546842.1 hypothetical protein [Limnoraphis robusta CCNP1324]
MSKNKFLTNPKNIAIATFTLVIVMGSIVALVPKFHRGSQFEEIEPVTLAPTPKPQVTLAPTPGGMPPRRHSAHRTSTKIKIVDDIVKKLEWGNIAFNTPQKIKLNEPTIIELVLSPTQSIEELQSSLESQEQVESAEIRISNQMEARLSGTGFKIEALIEEKQLISSGKTQWKWEVTPTKSGSQNLHLTLYAIIEVSGKEEKYRIETFKKTIEVEVSVGQHASTFVADNWQWLWASILVPTAPFIWKWYRKKQGSNLPA